MPNLTENYGLKKPLSEEFYDVNIQNENMDIIDKELKKRASIAVTNEVPEDTAFWIDPDDLSVEESHVLDKNNPHGVTLAQIGAAPAGFGLGTQEQTRIYSLTQLDNTINSGWYDLWLGSVEGETVAGSTHGSIYVNAGRMSIEQVFVPYRRDRKLIRTWFDDTGWGEWEWEKPHMILDFEFRTTERWNGKVVYTKLVNCGAFPAEGSKVHIGLLSSGVTKILRVSGTAEQMGYSVPYIDPNAAIHISGTVYGDGYVVLYVEKGDFTADNCIAQVWYVKE